MPISSESFVHRIRGQLESLPATERQLADFLLEFPGELASYTGNELAKLAGVSPATVSRFIRRLGYASYEAARRHVREERASGSPLFQAADNAPVADPVAVHFQQAQANLAATFGRLSGSELAEIAKAIAGADHVLIFGSRSSHGFALYLRWQLIQVVPNVTAIPGAGETLGEHVASLGRNDCVIVFGTRRQTPQMRAVIQGATRAHAKLLFISDRSSPDCADATWSLQCDCRGPGKLDDHASVLALCNVIATQVIEACGSAGRKRLAAIELAHEALDEL